MAYSMGFNMTLQFVSLDHPLLQVVLRRQQLGLKAPQASEDLQEDENKLGRGGGRGRGKGRGRGGRKGKKCVEPPVPTSEGEQPSGKRLPECQTPERRKLESDLMKVDDKTEKEEPMQISPPIKQTKKRARKTNKGEAASQPAGNSADPPPLPKAKARAKAKSKEEKAKSTQPTKKDGE